MATVASLRSELYKLRKKGIKRGRTLSGYKFSKSLPLVQYFRSKDKKPVAYMRKGELLQEISFLKDYLQKHTLKNVQKEWRNVKKTLKATIDPFNTGNIQITDEMAVDFLDYYYKNQDVDVWYDFVEDFLVDNYYEE